MSNLQPSIFNLEVFTLPPIRCRPSFLVVRLGRSDVLTFCWRPSPWPSTSGYVRSRSVRLSLYPGVKLELLIDNFEQMKKNKGNTVVQFIFFIEFQFLPDPRKPVAPHRWRQKEKRSLSPEHSKVSPELKTKQTEVRISTIIAATTIFQSAIIALSKHTQIYLCIYTVYI